MIPKYLTLSLVCTSILAGCGADDKDYETLERKAEQINKTDLSTDQVYLYMPSMAKAPRYAVSMAPFMQGQEKLVRLIYAADGLEVRQVSPDVISQAQINGNDLGRWADVPSDLSPIIKIPGTYHEYRCKEDEYNDCTNEEEENEDDNVTWKDKSFFTPEYEKLAVLERDWDDISTYSTGCYTPVGDARLSRDWGGYEVAEDGSLNIELEQDYQITNKWKCLINALFEGEGDLNFDNLTFTVSNHYSFVPLNSIRSTDYDPILYPKGDEDTFGMFATKVSRPDHLGNNTQDGNRIHYMHRFNPNLKTVDYHLSDSFNLNASTEFYKQITIDVIDRINPQLAKVGVPQIKLHEPSGKQSGDLRYNVINLIDEPLENGLAGYGPSAVNPVTGEIVHAHVNQYAGVLEAGANVMWDRIVTQFNDGNVTPIDSGDAGATASQPVTQPKSLQTVLQQSTPPEAFTLGETIADVTAATAQIPQSAQIPLVQTLKDTLTELDELQRVPEEDLTLLELTKMHKLEQRLWAENNMFPVSSLWASTTEKMLPEMVVAGKSIDFHSEKSYVWKGDAKTQLKSWSELTIAQQTHVGQVLAGTFYAKTLVHELGHNLGLRHNFKGSNDDVNYFTEQQAHDHGLKSVPAYSSIMDYNPSIMDALPVFGLYDKAALRFAYKRQIEITSGNDGKPFFELKGYDKELRDEFFAETTHLSERLDDGAINAVIFDREEEIKDAKKNKLPLPPAIVPRKYKFCTDGHVSLNTDCNRHDEGRNHGEINNYSWQRYYEQHEMRTHRNGRNNFDESTLEKYAVGRMSTFMGWRENIQVFDRYSKIIDRYYNINLANYFNISKSDPACDRENPAWPESGLDYDFFCAVPKSIDELRSELINIVIQPDHLCEVKDEAGTVSYKRLKDIINKNNVSSNLNQGEVPQSCFHPAVSAYFTATGLTLTAEAGKMLNSGKAPKTNPKFNYIGMVDYYGFWPDKFAAMAALLERNGIRSTTERTDTALADLPYIIPAGQGYYNFDIFTWLLDDIAFGTNYTQQNFYPDLFRDSEGNGVRPQGEFVNFDTETMVEAAPYYARALKRDFGLPEKGEYSEIKALLNLVVKFRYSETGEFTRGNELARYVSIRSTYEHTPSTVEFERKDGRLYYANSENYLAHKMITTLNEFEALFEALNDPDVDNSSLVLKYITLEQFNDAEQHAKLVKTIERYKAVLELLPIYHW